MTNYLLDTNALSEAPKANPNVGFIHWLTVIDELSLFTSCLVLGEVKKGISLVTDTGKLKHLTKWLDTTIEDFDGRIIDIDKDVCLLGGDLLAIGQQSGKTPPVIDALIAAQCLQYHLVLVTRNIKTFEQFTDLEVLCPWS